MGKLPSFIENTCLSKVVLVMKIHTPISIADSSVAFKLRHSEVFIQSKANSTHLHYIPCNYPIYEAHTFSFSSTLITQQRDDA